MDCGTNQIFDFFIALVHNAGNSQRMEEYAFRKVLDMVKISGESIILPLKQIFSNTLESGIFHDAWKRSNVCPIHKKNEKNLIKNYRSISFLPVFVKMLEKIIFDRI